MEKELGKDIANRVARAEFLKNNCDTCEKKSYMKPYTPEELQGLKEKLANTDMEISDLEAEFAKSKKEFKEEMNPLKDTHSFLLQNIKAKAQLVDEVCFKFVDVDERMTGYYNADGDLVECRPATADEMQPSLFPSQIKLSSTGTDGE